MIAREHSYDFTMALAPLSTAFLASAPFGLKLLIGLAAVDDGPKVVAHWAL
jgi:hypothetical protein